MKTPFGFLEDNTGGKSAARLYGLIASVGFWGSILFITILTRVLAVPSEWLVVAFLGTIATKTAQRIWGENDTAVSSEKTTTTTESQVVTPQEPPK